MKKYQVVLGYLTKLGNCKEVERFKISAANDDDAFNRLEAELRNYRGKTKAKRFYGHCYNEKLELIKTKHYNLNEIKDYDNIVEDFKIFYEELKKIRGC